MCVIFVAYGRRRSRAWTGTPHRGCVVTDRRSRSSGWTPGRDLTRRRHVDLMRTRRTAPVADTRRPPPRHSFAPGSPCVQLSSRARLATRPHAHHALNPHRDGGRSVAWHRWISPVALIALWQLASAPDCCPDKLSSPWTVLQAGVDDRPHRRAGRRVRRVHRPGRHRVRVRRRVAAVLGMVAGLSSWGNVLIDPPVQMLRTLPFLGLIPLFILWFGIGEEPRSSWSRSASRFPCTSTCTRASATSTTSWSRPRPRSGSRGGNGCGTWSCRPRCHRHSSGCGSRSASPGSR